MAGRSNTELKVFLNGSLDDYRAFCQNPNDPNAKLGSVFFDRDNKAVYVEGVLASSNVKNITYEGTLLTITLIDGTTFPIELSVEEDLNKLKTTLENWVKANYVAVNDIINTLDSSEQKKPLSAAQGKALKGLIDTNTTKLAGIDEGAQTNRYVTVNGDTLGLDSEYNKSTIKMSGNLVTAPNNGEDSKIEFYLSHKYYPTENKIRFFKTATPPETYNETTNGPDVVLTIDTSDFVQAGMINKVEYNSVTGELSITFPTIQTDGTLKDTTVKVDLSKLVDVYKAGNGLTATVGTDGTTFTVVLGDGLAFDANKAITLSLGSGLSIDNSGKLVVDIASNSVTSINGMGGGAYQINHEGVPVGTTENVLYPIQVFNDSAAKKLKIKARPADMLAQFFRENKNKENATSGIRAKGVLIEEAEGGNPYSMLMDFTPKVWKFEN